MINILSSILVLAPSNYTKNSVLILLLASFSFSLLEVNKESNSSIINKKVGENLREDFNTSLMKISKRNS